MASLLNTSAPFNSELSMVLQLLSLSILVFSFIVVKHKKHKAHGALMFLAWLLNIVSVIGVMIPSALSQLDTSISGFNLLFRTHIVLGIIVLGISVYILVEWRFREPGPTCFQRRKWMLGLSLAWMGQLITGMLLFLRLYV
jgi:uncharacterized membrane protein YozB (DUF420 family)